jgi:hypothetical protein
LNHEELIKELAKALGRIGNALPQAELKLKLYPTAAMKELVALLYIEITKFAQRSVAWYKEGKLKHTFSAIRRPYSLRFKDIVENVNEISRRMNKLASTMHMIDGRQIHIENQEAYAKLLQSCDSLEEMRLELKRTREKLEESER